MCVVKVPLLHEVRVPSRKEKAHSSGETKESLRSGLFLRCGQNEGKPGVMVKPWGLVTTRSPCALPGLKKKEEAGGWL